MTTLPVSCERDDAQAGRVGKTLDHPLSRRAHIAVALGQPWRYDRDVPHFANRTTHCRMAGDRIVRYVLLLWVALLVASCSPLGGSAGKGRDAPVDEKYNEALEYFTLTHESTGDPNHPIDAQREKPVSRIDRPTAQRLLSLQGALKAWRTEKPDSHVAGRDRREINEIIERLFENAASRDRMVVKTWDLKICEKVTIQFHNKNRCYAGIMFYDRGGAGQAGLDLYLFKYEGDWQLIYRVDWIG